MSVGPKVRQVIPNSIASKAILRCDHLLEYSNGFAPRWKVLSKPYTRALWALALVLSVASIEGQPAVAGASFRDQARIYGHLANEQRESLAGARVLLVRLSGSLRPALFQSRVTTTDRYGLFSFSGLPDGLYRLCPTVAGSDYVDPCLWAIDPPTVGLQAGQLDPGVRLVLRRGAILNIRVDDEEKKLKVKQQVPPSESVNLRVHSRKRAVDVDPSAEDDFGQNYLIAVPKGEAIQIELSGSKGIELKGVGQAAGVNLAQLPPGQRGPTPQNSITFAPSDSGLQLRFAVKGVGK